jgi:hypothetical protein
MAQTVQRHGLEQQRLCGGTVFFKACYFGHHRVRTYTRADLDEENRPRREAIERLREAAKLLRAEFSPHDGFADMSAIYAEHLKHVNAVEEAVNFFDADEAADALRDKEGVDLTLVGRNQGDPCQRAFALHLSSEAHRLFGSWLYETIAILTSVASGKRTTKANVRDWLRSYRDRRSLVERLYRKS